MRELLTTTGRFAWIGKHCETTAFKRVLDYYNIPVSENFLFGLGGGIGFFYWYSKKMKAPFLGTKNNVSQGMIMELGSKLGITVRRSETQSLKKAEQWLFEAIQAGKPAIVNVDMAQLPYTGVPQTAHFGGHAIAVFGYDRDNRQVFLYDRGKKLVAEDYSDFVKARSSEFAPFPPRNRMFILEPAGTVCVTADAVKQSLRQSYDSMMYAEMKNKGIAGLETWVRKLKQWPDSFPGKQFLGCLMGVVTNIIIGGTGGDAFRSMYAGFLEESSELLEDKRLHSAAVLYRECGRYWQEIAAAAMPGIYPYLHQVRVLMEKKNKVFEQGGPNAVDQLQALHSEEEGFIADAANEALKYQGEIICSLSECILSCRKVELAAAARIGECLEP